MIGNIYLFPCKPPGMEWGKYHLMPLVMFEAVKYREEDKAYKCLILETGMLYSVYRDLLDNDGELVG